MPRLHNGTGNQLRRTLNQLNRPDTGFRVERILLLGTIPGRSCGAVAQLHERGSPRFARENLETLGRRLTVLKPGRNIKTVRLNAEITAHGIPGARLYRNLIGSKLGVFGDLVFIGFGFTRF
jgi:hypothetical protein